MADQREGQVLSMVERIYSRVEYLGRDREHGKYKESSWRVWERVSARYERCLKRRKCLEEKNYQKGL